MCCPRAVQRRRWTVCRSWRTTRKRSWITPTGAAQLLSQSGIPELAEAITRKAWQLCHGKNAVGVRRISELVPVIDGVIRAADQRISDINLTMEGLQKQKEAFAKLREDDDLEQARITSGFMSLNKKYKESFTRLLKAIIPTIKSSCGGKARADLHAGWLFQALYRISAHEHRG